MKKFNQVISVQVSVDAIAENLLKTIKEDNPHREMIAEAIIGSTLASNKVSYIYNALNGFTNDIDFKVGQQVDCSDKVYQYDGDEEKYLPIGRAVILDIDLYKDQKLYIEYQKQTRKGGMTTQKTWVNHMTCNPCNEVAIEEQFNSLTPN